jgi:hypothetical protein
MFHACADNSSASRNSSRQVWTISTLCLIQFLPSAVVFQDLRGVARFGIAFALERTATLRINCEAVMWKITARGFTLEEVLVMAAMNLLVSNAAAAKREKPASQK